jgi:hypothetical protein
LQVRIGFYSQEADCRGAALLARTDPRTDAVVIRGTGESTLIVNFTGVGVSEPGPYRMEYVIVFCAHDHIGPREMIVPVSGAPSK